MSQRLGTAEEEVWLIATERLGEEDIEVSSAVLAGVDPKIFFLCASTKKEICLSVEPMLRRC